ncbi:MAG: hypothetical protein VX641_02040 [Planctomycetota bacterium]|nr:hypothetical protein [Planctomycetota bacterium]
MNVLLVKASSEQQALEGALRSGLHRAFPGEIQEVDATKLSTVRCTESEDVRLARSLLVADAVVMLLPFNHEDGSAGSIDNWLHRSMVDGITVMAMPDRMEGLLDTKPVFLLKPVEPELVEENPSPEGRARRGFASLGLNDITVVDIDPERLPFGLEPGDESRLN